MRIIAGKYRGRRLQSPDDRAIRPSSDRLRESLFNMLAHRPQHPLVDAQVAEVFAGSGALGFEALSRGAKAVTFLDTDPAARRLLAANARLLGATDACRIMAGDARRPPPADQAYSLIFMDPPYRQGLAAAALPALVKQGWVGPATWVVIERAAGDASEHIDWPGEQEIRHIGKSELLILHDYR